MSCPCGTRSGLFRSRSRVVVAMETMATVVETMAPMVETVAVVVAEVQAAVAVVETNVVMVTAVASVGTSSDDDSGDDSIVAL